MLCRVIDQIVVGQIVATIANEFGNWRRRRMNGQRMGGRGTDRFLGGANDNRGIVRAGSNISENLQVIYAVLNLL